MHTITFDKFSVRELKKIRYQHRKLRAYGYHKMHLMILNQTIKSRQKVNFDKLQKRLGQRMMKMLGDIHPAPAEHSG